MADPISFAERYWPSQDGLTLYARDYAARGRQAGLPVICLHGLTRNSADFENVAHRIAQAGRRVIVPDIRGRGRSDRDPDPRRYHPRTYARDIAGMMDRMGMDQAIFVGTSMGGIITMALAGIAPKRIAAAILNDVGPEVSPEGIARIIGYAGKASPVRSWQDAADYSRRINGAALPHLAASDWESFARRTFREGPTGPVLDYDPAISLSLAKPPGWIARQIAKLLFRKLAKGRPLMLIRGERSDILSVEIAERMQRTALHLERVEIAGVGHAPTLDEPVAVDAMARFLRTVP
ncbi:alpha/beta fold hydrolase [Sphingomonas xanthus]|uniref:Alpha/beta hydrolase n=1 Tax=Sphingomonas xanthus TaxID=2594473 RepID=A0A516IRS1_9SPHN|nr:alpha/beta hydrolase [Sphingomonas xanthus]QDP19603.1 alpha/beta hydrolase [Sphingomonas xanthus]